MPDRPNVLLICADHWPGGLIGVLGHPAVLTPTLDQLAWNGVAFTNAYAATPSCIPARRELMTGTHARTHGDRNFDERLPMPAHLPTMAQTFRDNGYQAFGVGKLHVYPQRDRIGFDDVKLVEEGRRQFGMNRDDYEMFLDEQGYAGREFGHGLSTNGYMARPWHLPESAHQVSWTVREMSKYIVRRDPRKPGFWYVSFSPPHPPLAPPQDYLDMYRDIEIDDPYYGDWSDPDTWPYALRARYHGRESYTPAAVRQARQAFYASLTHMDHQIRLLIGLLREEGILHDTAVMFTSDHGNMLGNHGLFAIDIMYEAAAKIPMILMPPESRQDVVGHNLRDDRLVVQADVFATLADLCGIDAPDTVEGLSMVGDARRDYIYGQHWDGPRATRMVRDGRYKLIYYPVGNRVQLFDIEQDPHEMREIAGDAAHADAQARLTGILISNLYGGDEAWARDGKLVGLPDQVIAHPGPGRHFGNQRGLRFGQSPAVNTRPSAPL